jgi:hypothetical protein
MRHVKLLCAMKTDAPFVIVGDKDAILRLTEPAAKFAVRQGNAVYLDDDEYQSRPTRAELEFEEAKTRNAEQVRDTLDLPGENEEVKRPYGNAPKSAWIRYAVYADSKLDPPPANPMTTERGEGLTKADLMSKYGERL